MWGLDPVPVSLWVLSQDSSFHLVQKHANEGNWKLNISQVCMSMKNGFSFYVEPSEELAIYPRCDLAVSALQLA